MKRSVRLAVTMFASLALMVGVAACGDDDEGAADETTSTTEATTTTTEAPDEGGEGGEEGGPPEENPCGEAGNGTLGPADPPADGATEVTLTGADYSFEGTDAMTTAGEYAVTFTNEGEELHEVVVFKVKDGEERPVEELLQLPEDQVGEVVTQVGMSFACPGATAEPVGMDLSEPGRYVAVCFIPVGTMADTDFSQMGPDSGPPHAMEGMVSEFQVA